MKCVPTKFFFFASSYGIMKQCWQMAPVDRPTFTELCLKLSSLIEQIADYLQMGYDPFIVGGGKGGEEEKKEKENDKEEQEEEEEEKEAKEEAKKERGEAGCM